MGVALCGARVRIPEKPPHDLKAEAARDQMPGIGVPIVMPPVTRDPGLTHRRSPELLRVLERCTSHIAGEQMLRARTAVDERGDKRRGLSTERQVLGSLLPRLVRG